MGEFSRQIAPYETVAFIGMCKNAGKTTSMNRMIRELHEARIPVALTSIGRDGESSDLVTDTVKPGIFVYRGTLVATAADLLKFCDVTREILDTTGIYTPLGEVVVLRAHSDGFVQAAGPSLTSQMARIREYLRSAQSGGKILVDGALERKSISTRQVSDAAILCTGASYSRDMRKTVADTAYTCELLCLPQTRLRIPEKDFREYAGKYFPIREDDTLEEKGSRTPEELWGRREHAEEPRKIYVQGGLTDAMIRPMLRSNPDLSGRQMVVKDGSRILLSREMYEALKRKGLEFAVQNRIRLAAVTVNPYSAYGYHYDREKFLTQMKREIPEIPVYDVREEA
jgi:hypothetical protein